MKLEINLTQGWMVVGDVAGTEIVILLDGRIVSKDKFTDVYSSRPCWK